MTICTGQALWSWISRKRLQIHIWLQWSTCRKWMLRNEMMTSRDPKRSRSWPRYRKMHISRKRWEIEAQYQMITNRKWHVANRMDTWQTKSRDLERSKSWLNYVWGLISQKRLFNRPHSGISYNWAWWRKCEKSLNSCTATYLCSPLHVCFNKTANINIKKLPFIHVVTASCTDWRIENSKNDKGWYSAVPRHQRCTLCARCLKVLS